MEHYIGCDTHQRYSVFVTMAEKGKAGKPVRVDHNGEKQDLKKYLKTLPAGAPVAMEAKKQMPGRMKTDKLGAWER